MPNMRNKYFHGPISSSVGSEGYRAECWQTRQETVEDEAPATGMVRVVMASSADCVGSSFSAKAIVSKNAP
jgi:hypothetical protein